ncbi:MAG: hypothetical protein ACF8TS_21085, partial [Maioricimonas sp. JB049]
QAWAEEKLLEGVRGFLGISPRAMVGGLSPMATTEEVDARLQQRSGAADVSELTKAMKENASATRELTRRSTPPPHQPAPVPAAALGN